MKMKWARKKEGPKIEGEGRGDDDESGDAGASSGVCETCSGYSSAVLRRCCRLIRTSREPDDKTG